MQKPLIFISHRHADRAIASKVAALLREWTGSQVRIYLSSNPDFEGPTPGAQLNDELKHALGESDVVLLVYTSDSEDWSYCMLECGIAIDPNDQKKTEVVVLQCVPAGPKPFADCLRVNLYEVDSIRRFLALFLTTTELFSNRSEPVTGFTDQSPEIKQFSERLCTEVGLLIPNAIAQPEERATSPSVRVEIDRDALTALQQHALDDASADAIVLDAAQVVKHRPDDLFGFELREGMTLSTIGARLRLKDGSVPRWLLSLAAQVRTAAAGGYPVGEWAPFCVEGDQCTIPLVTKSISFPITGAMQFEASFMPVLSRPVPVVERMIPIDSMFHKNLGDCPADKILLADLRAEMKKDNRSRVPILDEQRRPAYIIHGSVIADFLTDLATTGTDIRAVTLADLVADQALRELVSRSFAVVSRTATMGDATQALQAVENCQDIFVTSDGTPEGTVLGWLTNVMFVSPS